MIGWRVAKAGQLHARGAGNIGTHICAGDLVLAFFVGLHHPNHARFFDYSFISVNRIRKRRSSFPARCWIMDSGAFTEISRHGKYRHLPEEYAREIKRWSKHPGLIAAVTQDFMCEPFILAITGKTVREHQHLTIERYDALLRCGTDGVYLMPVLQGYAPKDYVEHCYLYGDRLQQGAWVGVGSICKRSGKPEVIAEILQGIKEARPDLELHGFGLKTTALADATVRELLTTADSMAWSFAARCQGRDANHWVEALEFVQRIEAKIWVSLCHTKV